MLLVRTSCARMQRKDPFSADVAIWSCCGAAWHWCDRAGIALPDELLCQKAVCVVLFCLKRVASLCGRFSTPYVACRKLGARMARCGPQAIFEVGGVACKMCPSEGICAEVQDIPTKGGAWGLWQSGCAERTGMRGENGFAAVRADMRR